MQAPQWEGAVHLFYVIFWLQREKERKHPPDPEGGWTVAAAAFLSLQVNGYATAAAVRARLSASHLL